MEATITPPKQRDLQNISVNYLVESCINEAKAKKVMEMMQEALDEDTEPFDDLYSDSDLNENMFREMVLNSNLSFYTRITEAYSRNPQVTKKIIREHYTDIIKDDAMRKQVLPAHAALGPRGQAPADQKAVPPRVLPEAGPVSQLRQPRPRHHRESSTCSPRTSAAPKALPKSCSS